LGIEPDDLAQIQEHSIEVQLPFLQFLFKDFKILPITIMSQDLNELMQLGNALAELKEDFDIIASSDFSHFIPAETAKQRDMLAIEKIKQLDVEGFHKMVVQRNLSICGHAPITTLMQYCRQKSFKHGKLLRYDSSASTTGDATNVVAYAAIKFE
ncbi:MAG: AmmeMemoRadiSam system protein B, partial [Candidatus Diapherotrites archaeon]|nr:AmmeMemoRadiSam system protein B [Candidatus Diapherotrites archaeon]